MQPVSPTLAVIIANWNTRDLLRQCILSVLQSSLDVQVIVVDNGSTDGSVQMVGGEFESVKLIVNSDNRGFAAANNQGLRAATAPYCMLLNSDTVVLDDALATLVRHMGENPHTGCCGPQLLNTDGTLQPSGHSYPTLRSALAELLPLPAWLRRVMRGPAEQRDYTEVCQVDEVSGAAMLVRRAALEDTGLLDEGFFFLGEDVDWCWRMTKRGWRVEYVPNARIVHHGGQSTIRGDASWLRAPRAYYRLFRKHRRPWEAELLRAAMSLIILLRMLRVNVARLLKSEKGAIRASIGMHLGTVRCLWTGSDSIP